MLCFWWQLHRFVNLAFPCKKSDCVVHSCKTHQKGAKSPPHRALNLDVGLEVILRLMALKVAWNLVEQEEFYFQQFLPQIIHPFYYSSLPRFQTWLPWVQVIHYFQNSLPFSLHQVVFFSILWNNSVILVFCDAFWFSWSKTWKQILNFNSPNSKDRETIIAPNYPVRFQLFFLKKN